jgi:hypothetical protein
MAKRINNPENNSDNRRGLDGMWHLVEFAPGALT